MANWAITKMKSKDFDPEFPHREKEQLTISIEGKPLRHKDVFEVVGEGNGEVYQLYFVQDGKTSNGKQFVCAGVLDRKTRLMRSSWGRGETRFFDLTNMNPSPGSPSLKALPSFKERNPKAEAAEKVWNQFPASVHRKFKAQAARCDYYKDGSPNFGSIGIMGPDDLKEELSMMRSDYYGEHISHPKFGVDFRQKFKNEDEAVEAFFEDPRAWSIRKWDGERWLVATMSGKGKNRTVVWKDDCTE